MAINNQSLYSRVFVDYFIVENVQPKVYKVPNGPVGDVFNIVENTVTTLTHDRLANQITDNLHVAPVLIGAGVKNKGEKLALGDRIDFHIDRGIGATESLNFEESVYVLLNGSPISIPITNITSLTLQGPGATTLVLRAPKFGNSEKLQFTRIGRYSRGGDLTVFMDPMWPRTDVFHFDFEYLSEAQVDALLIFYNSTLGRTIQLTDSNSRQWNGYIITPDGPIIQPKVHGYSASFDFQNGLDT